MNLFRQGKILEIAENIIKNCELSASKFELEITENLLIDDIKYCATVLSKLKNMGFRITIDDFGTGFSSMSYLKQLPIDCIKIDRSFVEDVCFNSDDSAIIQAIISLGHSLDLKVTAEGVENTEQLNFLSKHGCDEGQGYFYSEPKPVQEFESWLTKWNTQVNLASNS